MKTIKTVESEITEFGPMPIKEIVTYETCENCFRLEKENQELKEAIKFACSKVRDWESSNKSIASYRLCVAFDELDSALKEKK